MAFIDKIIDSKQASYTINNFSDEQLSDILVYKHSSDQLIQDVSVLVQVNQLAVDKGVFNYLQNDQSIAYVRVWKDEEIKQLHFHCTCLETPLRMCQHSSRILHEIVKNDAIRFFFDGTLRKMKLEKVGREYGLENEPDLVDYFYIHFTENKLTFTPKVNGLLKFTDETLAHLQRKLLPDAKPAFREQKIEAKAIIFYHNKNYHHLMVQLGELDFLAKGKVKSMKKIIDITALLWNETKPEHIRFLVAVSRFQHPVKEQYGEDDIRALHEIAKNPLGMPIYYHDHSEHFHAKYLTKVNLKIINRDDFTLEIRKKDAFFAVRALFQIENQQYNVTELPFAFDCFIHINQTFYLLKNYNVWKIAQFFRNHGTDLIVHGSKYQRLQSELLDKVNDSLKVDYSFLTDAGHRKDQPEVEISEKIIYLSDSESYVILEPMIRYGDVEIPLRSKRPVYGRDEQDRPFLIRRDEDSELQFLSFILKQHTYFSEQLEDDLQYFYLHQDRFFDGDWFLDAFEQWRTEQITIMGYEKLSRSKRSPYKAKIDIEVSSGINWFNTKIRVSYGQKLVRLRNLEKSIKNKSNYVLLDDGTHGVLPDEWLQKFEQFFRIAKREGELLKTAKINFQELQVAYSSDMFDTGVREELLRYEKWKNGEEDACLRIPKEFNGLLRSYQFDGVKWLHSLSRLGFGGCLADDMGLGKSIQIIAFLLLKKEEDKDSNKNLIVAPTTLLTNWLQEFEKFAPSLRVFLWHGSQRGVSVEEDSWDVILTSYGTMVSDITLFQQVDFAHIFLDESQHIKNPNSQRYRAASQLKARTKVAVTGTPLENNTFDLFGQVSFACPGLLGNKRYFRDVYSTPIDKFGVNQRLQELLHKIKPFILRRTKKEVMHELPEKTEMLVYCQMGEEQRKIYDAYEKEFRTYISAQTNEELTNKSAIILKGLTRLRQICNSPLLLRDQHSNVPNAAKVEWLMDELKQRSAQHKILIFSQYVHMLDLLEVEIDKLGIQHVKMTGHVKMKERRVLVDRFKSDENTRIFLISLKVGGIGLNLTEADYVYLVDPWWNPAVEDQAIDRVYRMGQDKHVIAIRLICKETIEEKVLQLQGSKNELFTKLVDSATLVKTSFSKDALLQLLSH